MPQQKQWVGTWTAAPAPAEGVAFSNITLRMNARVSLGGEVIRVRLSNAHGAKQLTIGAAHVGLRASGPAVQPDTNRRLSFGGDSAATIAAGSLLISDPVELEVPRLADRSRIPYREISSRSSAPGTTSSCSWPASPP